MVRMSNNIYHNKLRVNWDKAAGGFANWTKVAELLDEHCESWAAVDEGGYFDGKEYVDKHTHYYLVTRTKRATLAGYIRDLIGVNGRGQNNKVWSMPDKKILKNTPNQEFAVEYIVYMMKTGAEIVTSWKFPNEWLAIAKAYKDNAVADAAEDKKTRKTQLQLITEEFEQRPPVDRLGQPLRDAYSIAQFVVEYFKKSGKIVREFTLLSYAQTLALKFDPEYDLKLSMKIYEKMVK